MVIGLGGHRSSRERAGGRAVELWVGEGDGDGDGKGAIIDEAAISYQC